MDSSIVEMLPTPSVYNQLRSSVGWGTYEPALVASALPNSLFCVCAMVNDQVVAMARVIGDGGMVFYVQDVIVLPEYQHHGIGTRLMDAVVIYLRVHATTNSVIGLMAAKSKEQFYQRYGFITRPNEMLGCGMTTNLAAIQNHVL
jgi:GNAT superfamily N-acetyltransferase